MNKPASLATCFTCYEKLLAGGIWCIIKMEYVFNEEANGQSPFNIIDLKPIQMPNMDFRR